MGTKYIPKVSMCMVCKHFYRDCSHLPFEKFKPMAKQDDEGFIEVKCVEFEREQWDKKE
ncbi:MAG: hypothetical protein KAS32_27710 [Candidatus Peribacteraceae bacterium]|nr:hypothetical protein [Candidatus Peribacteraceae bacterium]